MELTRIRNNKVGLLAVLAAALVAASALMAAGASAKPAKKKQKVDIQFTATAGEKPVSCSKPIRGSARRSRRPISRICAST